MIEIKGPNSCVEFDAAAEIAKKFNDFWPDLKDSPKHKDHVLIKASAKISGYDREDFDVLIVGNFEQGRIFKPSYPVNDKDGNIVYGKSIIIKNFIVAVEVKDQDQRNIRISGDSIEHRYPNDLFKWHSTTDQNNEQVGSLRKYFQTQIKDNIYFHKLVYLRNMEQNSGIYLGSNFDATDFFTCIAHRSRVSFYNRNATYNLSSTTSEVIQKVFHARVFNELIATPFNRYDMDRIIKANDNTKKIASLLGNKFISLRGHGGSGKTILYLQSIWFAYEELNKRILILTFNTALSADIRRMLALLNIRADDYSRRVNVKTIHSHLYKIFSKFKLSNLDEDDYSNYEKLCIDFKEKMRKINLMEEIENDDDFNYDAVVIDEAQDFKNYEIDILKKIYGLKKICIADGIDQLMRGNRANWYSQKEKKDIYEIKLSESLRMKRNLGLFVETYIKQNNLNLGIRKSEVAKGGKVILLSRSYVNYPSLHEKLTKELKREKGERIDTLFCSTDENNLTNFFESCNEEYWNGFYKPTRKDFPRNNDAFRIFHYESIRGLEGWLVVLDEMDEYYEYLTKYRDPCIKKEEAIQRMLISLSRPIDTLVISVKNEDSEFAKILQKIANKNKDFVEFH